MKSPWNPSSLQGGQPGAPTFLLVILLASPLVAASDLSRGLLAFEQRQWPEAMEAFLETLRQDPGNTEAHAYINLVAREIEADRQAVIRSRRLQMLGEVSQTLEKQRL